MAYKRISRTNNEETVYADENHFTAISKNKDGFTHLNLSLKKIHNADIKKNINAASKELKKLGINLELEENDSSNILNIFFSNERLESKRTRGAGARRKKRWVKTEEILSMYESGMTQKEIAEKLELSQASISRRIKEAKENESKK